MQTSQYKWVFWAWRSDTWPWEHMPVHSPSLLWLLICLFIVVNKMYMQETSCLHLDLQLLCKDLIEKEKNPEGFFFSFQHKQSSAKSEAQMHQNDEKSLYIRKWLCISSPDWGRNKQGGKHWKARGIRVFSWQCPLWRPVSQCSGRYRKAYPASLSQVIGSTKEKCV